MIEDKVKTVITGHVDVAFVGTVAVTSGILIPKLVYLNAASTFPTS